MMTPAVDCYFDYISLRTSPSALRTSPRLTAPLATPPPHRTINPAVTLLQPSPHFYPFLHSPPRSCRMLLFNPYRACVVRIGSSAALALSAQRVKVVLHPVDPASSRGAVARGLLGAHDDRVGRPGLTRLQKTDDWDEGVIG